jgi:hypothetical protein
MQPLAQTAAHLRTLLKTRTPRTAMPYAAASNARLLQHKMLPKNGKAATRQPALPRAGSAATTVH